TVSYPSTSFPADHRPGIHDARRVLVVGPVGRVELNGPRPHGPRLGEDVRIIHGVLVEQGVALAPELLDDAHFGGVEPPRRGRYVRQPRVVVEPDGLDDQRVALPVSD